MRDQGVPKGELCSMKPAAVFRKLLAEPGLIVAPGVADAMNARIVAREGFKAVYMTGGGTSATRLGLPDVGLLTMPEMVDNAQRIADASGLPVIADADTGYGGPLNVRRTVQAYERAGVAAIHLEDQQWPKRCGHYVGKSLITAQEMASKIRAAVDARVDPDFAIIARTDAYSVEGFDSALDRARLYESAGADIIFVEELRSPEELRTAASAVKSPVLYNMASSGKTPFLSTQEIENLGFKIAIYPNFVMLAAIPAVQALLRALRDNGSIAGHSVEMASAQERLSILGLEEVQELERRYAVDDVTPIGF
jgi:2,3-dimethylmalate lyase